MKKIIAICLLFVISISLIGCHKKDPTKFHDWTTGNISYQSADIIYEIQSTPKEIINGFPYWEKDNIVLNIKYGWNAGKGISFEEIFEHPELELVCFASYIYWDYEHTKICNDYKKLENAILIEEIEKEIFMLDYYKANLGKGNIFYVSEPKFSTENPGLKIELIPEYIDLIEKITNGYKDFRFAVAPIYYNSTNNEYVVDFAGEYDGFRISYCYDENKELVHMTVN